MRRSSISRLRIASMLALARAIAASSGLYGRAGGADDRVSCSAVGDINNSDGVVPFEWLECEPYPNGLADAQCRRILHALTCGSFTSLPDGSSGAPRRTRCSPVKASTNSDMT